MHHRFIIQVCGALYLMQALRCTAETIKRLCHIPLGGRIEEQQFITRLYGADRDELHGRCIKKNIGPATVVDVLQEFRMQQYMPVLAGLYGQVAGRVENGFGFKGTDHIAFIEKRRGMQ